MWTALAPEEIEVDRGGAAWSINGGQAGKAKEAKKQQPKGGHPQIFQVFQLAGQAPEITHPIAVAVTKGTHVQFVNNTCFVPVRVPVQGVPVRFLNRFDLRYSHR